jgi:hypothetical protein
MRYFKSINFTLFVIIILSLGLRCIAAYSFGLNVDEAYYVSYALYPGLSHFDHPPMVGFLIQLTTWNLSFITQFAARLGFIILGTFSLFLFYLIGKKIKNKRTGFFAVCIAAASIYVDIFCGFTIIPDSPLLFFILLSFFFFLNFITKDPKEAKALDVLLAFLFFGLAIYSKYQAVFLGLGVLLYILFYNRKWFKNISIYFASLLPLFFIGLIVYWNYKNSFATLSFHGDRVIHLNNFDFPLLLMNIAYQVNVYNPINVVIIILAIFSFKKRRFIKTTHFKLILCCSIPLIISVLFLATYYKTGWHWPGISYVLLFFLAAAYLDVILNDIKYPAIYALFVIIIMGFFIVIAKAGHAGYADYLISWLSPANPDLSKPEYAKAVYSPPGPKKWETKLGSNDVTLTIQEWEKINSHYKIFVQKYPEYKSYPLVALDYTYAGQTDFYVALPNKIKLLSYGGIEKIHGYHYINNKRGNLAIGENALLIITSSHYDCPEDWIRHYFKKVNLIYRAPIYRNDKIVEFFFIYKLKYFTGEEGVDSLVKLLINMWKGKTNNSPPKVDKPKKLIITDLPFPSGRLALRQKLACRVDFRSASTPTDPSHIQNTIESLLHKGYDVIYVLKGNKDSKLYKTLTEGKYKNELEISMIKVAMENYIVFKLK